MFITCNDSLLSSIILHRCINLWPTDPRFISLLLFLSPWTWTCELYNCVIHFLCVKVSNKVNDLQVVFKCKNFSWLLFTSFWVTESWFHSFPASLSLIYISQTMFRRSREERGGRILSSLLMRKNTAFKIQSLYCHSSSSSQLPWSKKQWWRRYSSLNNSM